MENLEVKPKHLCENCGKPIWRNNLRLCLKCRRTSMSTLLNQNIPKIQSGNLKHRFWGKKEDNLRISTIQSNTRLHK
jgi:predicted amidophosphoribosyltransferase